MKDKADPNHGPEPQTEDSPLEVTPPKVTRFSRRAVVILSFLAFLVLSFSLIQTFSPKKRVQGKEIASEEKTANQPTPNLPDPLVGAPGSYGDLGPKKQPSAATAKAMKVAANTDTQETAPDPGPGRSSFAYNTRPVADTSSPSSSSSSPEAQRKTKERDRLAEEINSAIISPITFNGTDVPNQQPKTEQTATNALVIPSLPQPAKMTGGATNTGDDQNMQEEKRRFSGEREAEFPYVKGTLLSPLSSYEIKAGTILPALLITGINSDLPGQIVAQIRENVYDTVTGNYLLIPQGTKVIGEYDSKLAFAQERVLVVWTRLIFPNGNSLNLEGMPGADLRGFAGITGKVNNHYGKLVAGVVLGSVVGAGAQVATGGQGTAVTPPSFEQLAVSGAAQNINQAGQQYTQRVVNRQPTIEVSPGDKINVFVTKDMILQPLRE